MAFRRCAVRLAQPVEPNVYGTMGPGKYQDTASWVFWDPVWGGKTHAMFEEPYYTRREMSNNYLVDRPNEGNTHARHRAFFRPRHKSGSNSNPDMSWAARRTAESAIEVEATQVTCFGTGNSVALYFTPRGDTTGNQEMDYRHHMSWITVPPDRTVSCKYCRIHFKRKPGWSPGFDANLRPDIGHIAEGGSLDPCLQGVRKAERVAGAVDITKKST
ncbi:hypothetical protein DIPPA_02092 [Diplonema papillatum]|nr:hypothetical protein DIPPA_02092 [Diplonema papillatum]